MASLRLYPSGMTAFVPSGPIRNRVAPEKNQVSGWSRHSTRSLIRWLYSVNAQELDKVHSFTLTLRLCPKSPDHWRRLREAFFRSLHRQDVTQIFWLTEWQGRGVPHLHGIVILPADFSIHQFLTCWVHVAKKYNPSRECQHGRPVYDMRGWQEYLAKHSARGISNYQRSPHNIPKEWKGKTGRMWGKRGKWPTRTPIDFQFTERIFFKLRRLIRSQAVSLARTRKDGKAIKYARSMLKHNDHKVSRVRGLSRFCTYESALLFLDYLQTQGKIYQ